MDTPALFDTHASVKRLITAGMSEAIAEALVEEQQKWHNTNLANLATKQDIALLMKDTESLRQEMTYQFARVDDRIEATRQETKQDVESLHQEMIHQFARVDDRIEATRQETKQDVELLRQEVKQDAELLRQEVKQDAELLRQEVKQDVELLRQEVKIRTDSLTDQIINLKWLIGLMFGVLLTFNGFMLAIIKFL